MVSGAHGKLIFQRVSIETEDAVSQQNNKKKRTSAVQLQFAILIAHTGRVIGMMFFVGEPGS